MTLPVSGAISFNAINVELGVAGTTTANINQATYRTLAGVPGSGTTISLSNFYGKSNRATASITYAASAANVSQNLSALSGYSAGTTDITVTINAGVYLYATTTGGYGLNLSGATSGDTVTIVNNGFIMGQGGIGAGYPNSAYTAATVGGPALNLGIGVNPTINNQSGYIGGGGGGGGIGSASFWATGGGGAGGGAGGAFGTGGSLAGGTGGTIGSSGGNGNGASGGTQANKTGGGGGRIMPGTGGARTTNGAIDARGGGAGGAGALRIVSGGSPYGGAGGSAGGVGENGSLSTNVNKPRGGGGGGGWGASGGNGTGTNANIGAAGGKAVNLNGRSVTWTGGSASTNRVYGAIS
jgi:hypothetical protein